MQKQELQQQPPPQAPLVPVHLRYPQINQNKLITNAKGRPLSISSISSGTSTSLSGSSSSYAPPPTRQLPPRRASSKLQPSPSSASSHSNTSSLFKDDGFEDDTASERLSSTTSNYTNHRLTTTQSNATSSSSSSNSSSSTSSPFSQYRRHHKCLATHQQEPGYWDSNLSITQRVVTEIIETERTYVDDLEQIVTGYICYLRNVLKQQKHLQSQNSINDVMSPNDSTLASADNHQHKSGKRNNNNSNNNNNKIDYDDSKSMVVFDDEDQTESVTNEVVRDEEDGAEADNEDDDDDLAIKEEDEDDDEEEEEEEGEEVIILHDLTGVNHNYNNNINIKNAKEVSQTSNEAQQATDGAIMTAAHIKTLFSNLEDIYKFNKDLLFRLEECYLDPSSVAECFVENSSGFEVYTHYCTMYPQVVSTLTELMANQPSAQLLKERQHELNQSLPLGAYLLKPVQRILKYHILFQSLIKHTTDDETVDDKDRQLIGKAFSVMTSIARHINEMKKRHEHAIRVQEVQGLLSGWDGPDLTTLGELILEDTFKLYNKPKSSRHLFLFDNVLLITKKKRDETLCYKGHIACSNLMLIEKIEGQPLVFHTVPFDNPKALCMFRAKNLDKKRDWCLQMKEVMIKSFEDKIPIHVRDLVLSLTNSNITDNTSSKSENAKAMRAPNYLCRRRCGSKLR